MRKDKFILLLAVMNNLAALCNSAEKTNKNFYKINAKEEDISLNLLIKKELQIKNLRKLADDDEVDKSNNCDLSCSGCEEGQCICIDGFKVVKKCVARENNCDATCTGCDESGCGGQTDCTWDSSAKTCKLKCEVDNCVKCDTDTATCEACAIGYNLASNKCTKCNVENCAKCDTDTVTCDACANGYNLVSNTCKLKCEVDNCVKCDTDTVTCDACANDII